MADAAPITDYTSLKAAVARWLRRDGLTDETTEEIPNFVRLAEAEFFPLLRLWQMQRVAWAQPTDGEYVDLPENFLQPRIITLKREPKSSAASVASIIVVNSDRWSEVNRQGGAAYPRYGIIRSHRLYFSQAIGASLWVELDYYAEPSPLGISDGVQIVMTNEVLTHYPNIYLFGTLAIAGEFAREVDKDRWRAMVTGVIDKANIASVAAGVGPTPQMRMPR